MRKRASSWRHLLFVKPPRTIEASFHVLLSVVGVGLVAYSLTDAADIVSTYPNTDPRMLGHAVMVLLGLALWFAFTFAATVVEVKALREETRGHRWLTWMNRGLIVALWLVPPAATVTFVYCVRGG